MKSIIEILIARIAFWLGYGCRSITTNRNQFSRGIQKINMLLAEVSHDILETPGSIKPQPGLTPTMLNWSVYMTIEHTDQVHVEILHLIELLERGERPSLGDISRFDTVGPAGPDVLKDFYKHARQIETLPDRISLTSRNRVHHRIFGSLNSRGLYAALAMHLWLHVSQIKAILEKHAQKYSREQ
jgi:hypothetical protein